jgi:hypothetical protein
MAEELRIPNPGKGQISLLFSTTSKPVLWPTEHPIKWVLGALSLRGSKVARE